MEFFLNPKYIPMVQKPRCCSAACLQMILYRRGFGLYNQEKIAKRLNTRVGEDDFNIFDEKFSICNSNSDSGINILDSEKIINRLLSEEKIPLIANAIPSSRIKNIEEFFVDNLLKNNDLWIDYELQKLNAKTKSKKYYIPDWMSVHDSLIEGIKKNNDKKHFILVDPFWYNKSRNNVLVSDLEKALNGLILISSK